MKRKQIVLVIIYILVICIIVICGNAMKRAINIVKLSKDSCVVIQYERDGKKSMQELEKDDAKIIVDILDKHVEYKENYSCGFSDALAIIIDQRTFYIASDGCPFILDTTNNLFIKISKNEKHTISDIFSKHGGIVYWQ